MNILDGLNDMQKEAVLTTEGPVLILAGAGSGKTKALTHRIAYLIKEKKISPYNILAVTFTNKAAGEMGSRVTSLLSKSEIQNTNPGSPIKSGMTERGGYDWRLPWLGTFHSICVRILRREVDAAGLGFNRNFTIWDSSDSQSAIKRIMKDLSIDSKQYNPAVIQSFISGAKNEFMNASQYKQYANGIFQEIVSNVFDRYEVLAKENNAMDFDDLMTNTLKMFEQNPEILAKYQEQFSYVLVDEYQDTNRAQYLLIKMFSKKNQNIFVIGDDYQSIYSWRGADFRNILNFEKDWPKAKVIKLEQNYRSTQNILDAGQAIIEKNVHRSDKKLWTKAGSGDPILIVECLNEKDEGEYILQEIERLMKIGDDPSGHLYTYDDFVILYRTNAQSRLLEETFVKYFVPYRIVGGLKFYERKEVKDILAYLRLLVNPRDLVSLERIINVPPRGIGDKNMDEILNECRGERPFAPTGNPINIENPKGRGFFETMDRIRANTVDASPDETVMRVVEMTGYKKFVLDGTIEGESRWENIKELASAAVGFADITEFLEQTALIQDTDDLSLKFEIANKEAVTLMTLHSSKGLEFPVVFMAGMEEGIMPHTRSLQDAAEMEEERRLCYVGITRAKHRLYLLHAFERRLWGNLQANLRSRFLDELPEHLVEEI